MSMHIVNLIENIEIKDDKEINDQNIKISSKTTRKIKKPVETLERIPKLLEDSSKGQIRKFQILVSDEKNIVECVNGLTDTGATMSFINEKFLEKLVQMNEKITVMETRPFTITTANGDKIVKGKYVNLWVRQNDENYNWKRLKLFINSDFQLEDAKLILGISDLKLLGIFLATVYDDKLIFKNEGKIHISDTIKELENHGNVGYDQKTNQLMANKVENELTEEEKLQNELNAVVHDVQVRRGKEIAMILRKYLVKYFECFAKKKYDIGTIPGVEFKIQLRPDCKPVRQKPMRSNNKQLNDELYNNIQELLKAGVLAKVDQSDWQTAVFIVVNHDGSTRMVTNYTKLNDASLDEAHPVTTVPEMMRHFAGKTVFSKFDICKAFMNVAVAKDTQKLLTIVTPWGCYKYVKMPFGHKNCPATWSRAADLVFGDCKDLIYYVDDIVLCSEKSKEKSANENHFDAMVNFFDKLQKFNLKIKLSKCQFLVDQFTWLGKIVSKNGIKPDDKYIKKILQYRPPTNLTEYRRWLGLLEWIGNHVYCLKEIMHPMRELKKQTKQFKWTNNHERAFRKIKEIIQTTEVIKHPDFSKPFVLHVDASNNSYGGILMQTEEEFNSETLSNKNTKFYIIDMFSRFWSDSETNLHITSKELLALINAINKWSNYISMQKFYISTDLNNIPHLLKLTEDKIKLNAQHHRWAAYLLGLNFEVRHIKGVENKVADFLSRLSKSDIIAAYSEKVAMCYMGNDLVNLSNAYLETYNKEMVKQVKFYELLSRYPTRSTRNPRPKYANDGTSIAKHYSNDATSSIPLEKEETGVSQSNTQSKSQSNDKKQEMKENIMDKKLSNDEWKIPNQKDGNYRENRNQYQDKIIDTIEELQSDHESSEASFRVDDVERNSTILQDPILAKNLLKSWKTKEDIFNRKIIKRNQIADPVVNEIKEVLEGNQKPNELPKRLQILVGNNNVRMAKDGVIEVRIPSENTWKIYAPAQHKFALMEYFHKSITSIHSGIAATKNSIKQYFYWPNLGKDIQDFISNCQICRQAKNFKDIVFNETINWKPTEFNQTIAIDHKGPLPRTKSGNRYIMNIIDLFSGYVESIPLPRIGAATTSYNILSRWIFRYGIPNSILTDQGSDFTSDLVAQLCEQLDIKKKFSSAYTPQGNGQIERFHRVLSESLKVIVQERKISFNEPNAPWDIYLPHIQSKHNNQWS